MRVRQNCSGILDYKEEVHFLEEQFIATGYEQQKVVKIKEDRDYIQGKLMKWGNKEQILEEMKTNIQIPNLIQYNSQSTVFKKIVK